MGHCECICITKAGCSQNRAMRLITRSQFRSSCDPLFSCLNLLKLPDINKFITAQFMYKIKHHLLPSCCLRYVTVTEPQRSHNTRKFGYFTIVGCRTVIRENSIGVQGPRICNSLPKDIQDLSSLVLLKVDLSNCLQISIKLL